MQENAEKPLGTDDILKFLNSLSQELQRKGCVSKSDYKILFWVIQRFLRLSSPQPQHLDEVDELLASQLRPQGFSYDDIAFVLDRAKSSVFELFKK